MHYFQWNIADYRKDTQHLSPMEHYIYRELMDWYYLDESPIPRETQRVLRRLRLVSENAEDLAYVLDEFFEDTEKGWVHNRIERELEVYRAKADTARANGSKGGRPKKPKKTQRVNSGNPEKTGSKANHKPITNNQEPIIKESSAIAVNDSPDVKFAEYMLAKIIAVMPKTRQPNIDSWANTIRLMREQDTLDPKNIKQVFDWANQDQFWSTNILSPAALRKQFARLDAESVKDKGAGIAVSASERISRGENVPTRERPISSDLHDRSWA